MGLCHGGALLAPLLHTQCIGVAIVVQCKAVHVVVSLQYTHVAKHPWYASPKYPHHTRTYRDSTACWLRVCGNTGPCSVWYEYWSVCVCVLECVGVIMCVLECVCASVCVHHVTQ